MRNFNIKTLVSTFTASAILVMGLAATAASGGTWIDVNVELGSYTGNMTNATVYLFDTNSKLQGFCVADNTVVVGANHIASFQCPLTGYGASAKSVKFDSNEYTEVLDASLINSTTLKLTDTGMVKGHLVAFDIDGEEPTW